MNINILHSIRYKQLLHSHTVFSMKYLAAFFLCILSFQNVNAQSISLFGIDASGFPTIKAKFYAFDAAGNQVRPSAAELTLTEDGQPRTITGVTCLSPKPPVAISSVLTVDVSGSMSSGPTVVSNLDLAKAAARAWIQGLPAGQSECALSSFDDNNYLHQDFTTDRSRLLSKLSTLSPNGGTDYDKGLLQPIAGSLQISQRGKYKRVVVFLSDGLPNSEPNTSAIIAEAKKQNCMIFAVTLGMPCPQSLKDISSQTGGQWYENVTTTPEAEEVYRKIMQVAVGSDPCEITWTSIAACQASVTTVEIARQSNKSSVEYIPPASALVSLKVEPNFIAFGKWLPSTTNDMKVTLTAQNTDINVKNINRKFGSADFTVVNITFPLFIPKNTSQTITIRFAPSDSSIKYASFEVETDKCSAYFGTNGGVFGQKMISKTLKLTKPNGGENFVAGCDTLITWDGIAKSDSVELEYSIDNGSSWESITTTANNLQHIWKNIPKPAGRQCKIRVTQHSGDSSIKPGTVQFTLGGIHQVSIRFAWSPDRGKVATGSLDNTCIIWDATGAQLLTLTGHTSGVNSVTWSPDGTKVATGSGDKTCIIWNASSGAKLLTLSKHTSNVYSVSWSPDGTKIASGSNDRSCIIWDALSGMNLLTLSGHTSQVASISWNPDGRKICTGSGDKTCIIWDASSGAKLQTISGQDPITSVSWSPDGSKIATGDDDAYIIWEASSGIQLFTFIGRSLSVTSVSWSPDGKRLATGTKDNTCIIWNASSGMKLLTLIGHLSSVKSVSWSPDGTKVVTGSYDKSCIIWDASNGTKLLTLSGHSSSIISVSWSPDGRKIATGSNDKTCIIWDASGAQLLTLGGHTEYIYSVAWSPDSKKVATGSKDHTCNIWDVSTGAQLLTLTGLSEFSSVAWSPDGTKIATGSEATASKDNKCIIWDPSSGAKLLTLDGHSSGVTSVSWSPDGSKIATGSRDRTCIIWDASSGAQLLTLKGHTNYVFSVAWSPDGTRIATGSFDNSSIIWDASSGMIHLTLSGHTSAVYSVSWSPDGTKVATGSLDNSSIIWDLSGIELLTLNGHKPGVYSVSWSPDGTRIATGGADYSAKLWFVDVPTLQQDESDSVFNIVEPQVTARNIDMHRCLVGSVKDSVISTFISNIGSYKCRVDSIYFTGNDASAFSFVSGVQHYEIEVGDSKATEFRFIPKRIGMHSATINIITQSDTLQQTIIGEGITPALAVVNNLIDFGQVFVGNQKDTLRAVTIKNVGTAPLSIITTRHAGPNDVDFSTLAGGGNFTLQPNDTALLDLRFVPIDIGRTSGRILFEYDGVGSPAAVQLFGEGIIQGTIPSITSTQNIAFDSICVGQNKILQATIKNDGTEQLQLLRAEWISNVGNVFTVNLPPQPLTVDSSIILDINFEPTLVGLVSAQVRWIADKDTAFSTVSGIGKTCSNISDTARMTVVAQDITAQAGEKVNLILKIEKQTGMHIAGAPTDWYASVHYNKSMLFNEQSQNVCAGTEDSCVLELTGTYNPKTDELISIPCIATLGTTDNSMIIIDDFRWLNSSIITETQTQNGKITITGACEEGGVRLYIPGTQETSLTTRPNPAQNSLQVQYGVREPLTLTLELLNMTGQVVQTIFSDQQKTEGQYLLTSDLSTIGNGIYILRLTSNRGVLTTRVDVVK
ncbi:MAG: choice-of-anchor D domain-containing protein [Ignavibacteria bacterium]|nr:choice-of-anchor D domain-containing protein [Ignavibacteria bacterium]